MAEQPNIFKKNRIAVELLIEDAINFTVEKFRQGRTNFTVASAYGQIIFVLNNLMQLILYYIEDSITELNINTATRSNSVVGLARLAGHNTTRAISAIGEVALSVKSGADLDIPGATVVIPNYTKLKCVNNGQTYMVDLPSDEVRIPLDGSKNGTLINIIQGTLETQVFQGTGKILQSFSPNYSQSLLIEHFRVNVFVNGEKWKAYDSFYDMPRDAKACIVKTGINSGIDIIFGNLHFGKVPDLGAEIKVEYILSSGINGNITLATEEEAVYMWEDPGFSLYGDDIDMNEVLTVKNINPPDFGSNPELLELTRLIAPKTSRAYTLANEDHYIVFMEKFNQFSIIDAYTTPDDADITDDKIIYLFLVPDIQKRLKSNENYFNIDESRFVLNDSQKSKILTLIERSGQKIVSTEVQIVDPSISRFVVNVALIIFDDIPQDIIKQDVVSKLSEYFLNVRRRDRIPRSDLISIMENVQGVDSVNVSIISEIDEREYVLSLTSGRSSTVNEPARIDEFGDILIQNDELAIIRGGWDDRRGITYDKDVDDSVPSSVNIIIKKVIPRTYNSSVNQNTKNNIRGI